MSGHKGHGRLRYIRVAKGNLAITGSKPSLWYWTLYDKAGNAIVRSYAQETPLRAVQDARRVFLGSGEKFYWTISEDRAKTKRQLQFAATVHDAEETYKEVR
ncbi:hypothetical protein TIN4_58 [Tsukamurella phage TIN4]|uniref:Uncharacterized protein n=2 Tax=Tinduovirus TIN3 TaxID=1982571 RepID=A0A0K0N623_9CAUD|nr:hypothetical protein AVT54_gp067 [Tsukamurella phage TIN3]YP_009604188.1 hypothetical protein FDH87_gp067 [Tsukamurella phage TIN4]AKJ71855.1 hypothetical protein TIN3_58 [Tsukamurella phage TIN3]AKJ71964.1 hypothetical protein TIN4_58 [Tsukamurella phage TIN4]